MNFGNLGFTEILILLLILVLFFGAKRIPEIGASIGKGIREFKNSLRDGGEDEDRRVESPRTGAESLPPSGDAPKRLNQ